ncbi:RNA polymerase sigma factor (sigma-70 family) [Natranaerovirga hydrolytica]|uniref:RNA polymerase sigma factor (Sigma-70 family) n=1 Tax=Natranaerovirga hydrolytica TaxID=680378 RepID=A0A4R1MRR7_9FIRM|nr:sigma-70 family RNA polymerase sigma factor [Natranaerovirga hydrolytica]TCK92603.1 RNA polymerase sigma factor (sigma-70 family) [Natranaerovirga hydrolytica]
MSFNKGYEFKRFEKQWEQEKIWMRTEGMRDGDIKKMYEYDRIYFNSRRRYEEHRVGEIQSDHLGVEEDFEQNLEFMDLIRDEKLFRAISQLKTNELELLKLFAIHDMRVTEIAHLKGKSKSNISEKLTRIIEKVKKNYNNPNKN